MKRTKREVRVHSLFGGERALRTKPDRTTLRKYLEATLPGLTLDEFAHLLTNEFQMAVEYFDLLYGSNSCQRMSLLFNPHRLSVRTKSSLISVYEASKSSRHLDGMARVILARKKEKIRLHDMLYRAFEWGVNGVQLLNEFSPGVTRDLCQRFRLGTGSKVLDPCGGWGGRMIGASAVVNRYVCYEPATRTADGLRRLATQLHDFNPSFNAKVIVKPFEDSQIRSGTFDFALTSPPYYDTEIYTDEKTNSLNRYRTFDKWVAGFYLPLLDKTMSALKPGGVFVLNIGSRMYPLSTIMQRHAVGRYQVQKLGALLSGVAGLGKSGEGEMFYAISRSE